ncbi:MAG: flagellar basal body P-ring protein FlgI [Spirochaetia bacterium]
MNKFKLVYKYMLLTVFVIVLGIGPCWLAPLEAQTAEVKIRDIASIEGVRSNQLVGFGLVTGLQGEGDSSRSQLNKKLLSNLLASFDVNIAADEIDSKNSAAVVVTAEVPPFIRAGQTVDVTVSSLMDARNISGGVLLQTNLKAANGQVYAVAQGQVVSSYSTADGQASDRRTTANIISGAIIERPVLSEIRDESGVAVLLNSPDFSLAIAVRDVIRQEFEEFGVRAVDAEKIEVIPGPESDIGYTELSARIEQLSVNPDFPARVVINRRSGVVVMGKSVRIAPVVVSFNSSEISVGWSPTDETKQESSVQFDDTVRVEELVSVLKEAGMKVDDIIEVLKTIQRAGALYGTLEVM